MKKPLLLILSFIFITFSCDNLGFLSDDEDDELGSTILYGNQTSSYKMNIISSDSIPLNANIIDATVEGGTIEIKQIDETTWGYVFSSIPSTQTVVNVAFTLDNVNYIIRHNLIQITLEGSPKEIYDGYLNDVSNAKQQIVDAESVLKISTTVEVFEELWNKSSDEEKKEFAEFYTANKAILNELLHPTVIEKSLALSSGSESFHSSIDDHTKAALAFGASVYAMGASVQLGIRSLGNPLIAAGWAAGAIISFTSAILIWDNLSNKTLEVLDIKLLEPLQSKSQVFVKNLNTTYMQEEGEAKVYFITLTLTNLSENSKSPMLARVYGQYKNLLEITNGINSVIHFVNDYNPFKSIPTVTPPKVPPVLKETRNINAEEFDKLNISNGNNMLKQTASYSNGGVALVYNKKLNVDYSNYETLDSKVDIILQTDYANFNTVLDIEVSLKTVCVELIGMWQLLYYADDSRATVNQIMELDFQDISDDLDLGDHYTSHVGVPIRYYYAAESRWDASADPYAYNDFWTQTCVSAGKYVRLSSTYWGNIQYRFYIDEDTPNELIGESIGLSNGGRNMKLVKK